MKISKPAFSIIIGALLIPIMFLSTGCNQGSKEKTEESEESGIRYTQEQKLDEVRKGLQLFLEYDKSNSSFVGRMKNISKKVVKKARVEVHLSNGVELGPTKAVNIIPGRTVRVTLAADNQSFTWYSAHAESGTSEHDGKNDGEHGGKERSSEHGDREGGGEHR